MESQKLNTLLRVKSQQKLSLIEVKEYCRVSRYRINVGDLNPISTGILSVKESPPFGLPI